MVDLNNSITAQGVDQSLAGDFKAYGAVDMSTAWSVSWPVISLAIW